MKLKCTNPNCRKVIYVNAKPGFFKGQPCPVPECWGSVVPVK